MVSNSGYDTYLSNNILDSITETTDTTSLEIDTTSVHGSGYKYVEDRRLIKNDGTGFTYTIAESQANCTTADTFLNFNTFTGNEANIQCTGSAGVIAYNTFTGSHYSFIPDKTGLEILMLLEATGEPLTSFPDKIEKKEIEEDDPTAIDIVSGTSTYKSKPRIKKIIDVAVKSGASPKSHLVKSQICKTRKSPQAWGFYGGTDKEGRDLVLSIGTGFAWVYNEGLNVGIGDYLMSSEQAGLVVKQDDDLLHNYTVGKAIEPIIWNIGETKRKIAVTYHGG